MSRPNAPTGQAASQLNTAIKHHQSGHNTKALETIQRVLARNPKLSDAHYLAAGILIATGDLDRALYHAKQAVASSPDRAEFHAALGSVHATNKQYADSIPHYEQALSINAALPDALNGLGVAFKETGRVTKAAGLFDRLLGIQPDNQDAIINRALLDANTGRAHDAVVRLEDASKRFPKNPVLHDLLALTSSYDDAITPEQCFAYHKRFGEVMRGHIRPQATHPNSPDPDRKLRVGYISAEFRRHSNSYFLAPIIDNHDKNRFEVFLYSTNGYSDAVTDRLRSSAAHWRLHRSNELRAIIDAVIEDKIDILIELTGHFASNNLPVLAAKPAPVQITYLGYANTTGLGTIDRRIVDQTTDPEPAADALSTESLIRIDGCFLTYEPPSVSPNLRAPDPDRPLTFASFNDLKKLTPSTVDAWCAILKNTPGSRLVLKNAQLEHEEVREQIIERFAAEGIARERIDAIGRIESLAGHLDLYNEVDIALDTFPYAGTTTTCEALSMGVPVVTLVGDAHAGRVGASILDAIGCNDLCTPDVGSYIALGCSLGEQGKRTKEQRSALRARFMESALLDAPSFTRKLEGAYRHAWAQWCRAHGAKQ